MRLLMLDWVSDYLYVNESIHHETYHMQAKREKHNYYLAVELNV